MSNIDVTFLIKLKLILLNESLMFSLWAKGRLKQAVKFLKRQCTLVLKLHL